MWSAYLVFHYSTPRFSNLTTSGRCDEFIGTPKAAIEIVCGLFRASYLRLHGGPILARGRRLPSREVLQTHDSQHSNGRY